MINNDFKYCLVYVDRGHHDCQSYGCTDEGICRCYKIETVEIKNISIKKITSKIFLDRFSPNEKSWARDEKLFGLINNVNVENREFTYFYEYCISRILTKNKIWDKSAWIISWSPGYYGDEIDSVSIKTNLFDKVVSQIEEVFSLQTIYDMTQYLLKLEYDYILDKLLDKNYTIKQINTKDIIFPQQKHHQKVIKKDVSYLDETFSDDIQGVCLQENDKYLVIDGYHRMNYWKNKAKKITIISIC